MTRYTVFFGIAVAVGLAGCGRARTSQETVASSTTDTATDEAMTVVGCLVPSGETAESKAVGTSGNPQPPRFTLANVSTPVKGSDARSFGLIADEGRLDDLRRFANSRVEITGSIVAPPNEVRRIRVKDVRQLERTCGQLKKQ